MIETLFGRIFETDAVGCVIIIECAGVGYRVTVTANTLAHLPSPSYAPDGTQLEGKPVRIYTHMAVREDGVDLYGFYTREELNMFRLLISVSGIGPKAAISILSLFTPKSLAAAVASDDAKSISRAPGIGAKTAARVVLEMKDKIKKNFPYFTPDGADDEFIPAKSGSEQQSNKLADARDALTVLGYSRSEIAAAMKNIDMASPLEDIIKNALNVLMKN
ncbi:MAG: Holliday junction branch migration protein RuvA [Ruminococcaceae bacterium]|nr:Holliday junction branch migration protein RuvA [Oscillospiraceae bacterium]